MSTANKKFVQDLYAAFMRGDIQAIVDACAPDVTWGIVGREQDLPMLGIRSGKAGVAVFFQTMHDIHDITEFEPKTFVAAEDKVFVWGRYRWIMRANGCPGENEWLHVATIQDGRIASWRGYNDTAYLVAAYRAAPAAAAKKAANG
jgi:uncharacterized protein